MARTLWLIGSALSLALLAAALPASGSTLHIEADTYSTSGNIQGCGDPIERVNCDAATEGIAVEGVDCDGEWILIPVTIPSDFCFTTGLRSARVEGVVSTFAIEIHATDAERTLVGSDSLVTLPGQGVG